MKVLGRHVRFAGRSSAVVITLRHIYFDIKVWSHVLAMIVQSISVQQVKWNFISPYTWRSNSFAVVYVVKISVEEIPLKSTFRNVLLNWDLTIFNTYKFRVLGVLFYAVIWNLYTILDVKRFLVLYSVIHIFLYSILSTCYVQICVISCLRCNHFCRFRWCFLLRLLVCLSVNKITHGPVTHWFRTKWFGILNQFLHISTPRAFLQTLHRAVVLDECSSYFWAV